MIVAFSGIDCSGKSTQIALLSAALSRAGRHPRVLWLRPGYSPLLDGMRRLIRRLRPSALPTVADPTARQRVFQQGRVQRTWVVVALVDALLHYGLVVRWWSLLGQVVICDRYVEDALLDLRLRFPSLGTEGWFLARLLRIFSPRPDVKVLLAIPRDEMLRRMDVKKEPFPDSPEVRDRRYDEYLGYADRGYVVVDGARAIEAVHEDVRRLVAPGERRR